MKALGRKPSRSDTRALMFASFAEPPKKLPTATNHWKRRVPFPIRSFRNTEMGNCTRAKQAIAHMRMERLEVRRTPAIDDEEVVRVYHEMTEELYGGGDVGAYETDALSAWRKPEKTFADTKGRPLTIDAFTRLDARNHEQVKTALYLAGAKGIAVCFNLPAAWQTIEPPLAWDIHPLGRSPVGEWEPGTWGGHSMWSDDYDSRGIWVVHTWDLPRQLVTWEGAALYMDEAHLVIDSWDSWRKKAALRKVLDLEGIRKAVNNVSSRKIA